MMTVCWNVCTVAALAFSLSMQSTRVLLEQALDEPTRIALKDVRLGDAIELITKQTGVEIVMPQEVMNLVPHGADTLIHEVEIAGVPLRRGLTELLTPLGMKFAVVENHVEIMPKEALLCLGRPATWDELDALAELSALEPGLKDSALESLRLRFQFRLREPGAWERLSQTIRNIGAGPGDEILTVACAQLGWGWCLSGKHFVVTPLEQQIIARLQHPISLRIKGQPLFDVLLAIGRAANVDLHTEPAALASLPMSIQRNFSLNVHQQSAEQVLDTIAAYTGLGYLIEPGGVLFYNTVTESRSSWPASDEANDATGPSLDPYVAKLAVPLEDGESVEWLIRRSELPDDLRQMRKRDLARMIEALRRKRSAQNP